jgi:hypothetical protein
MPINWVDKAVAPGAVIAVDLTTMKMVPQYNEIASYVMTGVGYIAGFLGLGGSKVQDFLLNVGVASAPLTARALYARFSQPVAQKYGGGAAQRLALQNLAGHAPVKREYQPEFAKSGSFAI